MNRKELFDRIRDMLEGIPDGRFDALCIFEDTVCSREELAVHGDEPVPEDTCVRGINAANKRIEGYPLQYILGQWEFYGITLSVGEGVLIPRADTEVLVDAALEAAGKLYRGIPLRIADLCSGSGCIAIALAHYLKERAQVFALEYSADAMPYLMKNINDSGENVQIIRGDVSNGHLLENFISPDDDSRPGLDMIVSNPPYLTDDEMASLQREVAYEPQIALYGGTDGLKFYRVIACLWREALKEGGYLLFEIGDAQEAQVRSIMEDSGFEDIRGYKDGAGCIRCLAGRKA
ncbi:MAG: peptide chain release factor N(5)-glutamine methyltransferase [Oscillospiraceae bacterium]|nr:peptide chain release factor N(5)-glutamine methyltransferase [Oscillospiraceae bacterium]